MGTREATEPPLESLAALRARSADEVAAMRGAGMIVDGWIVPEDLSNTFADGRQNPVDVLVGVNKDEGTTFGPGATAEQWARQVRERWGDLADAYLRLYPAGSDAEAADSSVAQRSDEMFWHMKVFADAQARLGKRAWLYYFTHEPPYAPGVESLGATHTVEIPYVFDNLGAPRVFPDASSPELAAASEAERAFAGRVSSYWVNFARTGDPNGDALEPWPAFGGGDDWHAMSLGPPVEPPGIGTLRLYDQLYARQMGR
jgi:para-nitrobenzyl esterase